MKVTYTSNNSGGSWWLSDDDWKKLEQAGWQVSWMPDRWLGGLAKECSKEFPTIKEALVEFEAVTGQDVSDDGCDCCGAPHRFEWEDDSASGSALLQVL